MRLTRNCSIMVSGKLLLFTMVLGALMLAHTAARPNGISSPAMIQKLTEQKKIELLIKYIASLEHAVFIRNGSEHTPTEAADHLKLKRKNAGSAVKTARDFIDKCATKSSLSGKPYAIRTPDGLERPAAEMLKEELKRMEGR